MELPTLERVIRQYVQIPPRPNTKGFFPVVCRVCNDHGRKGKRAGFKFDGEIVGYNCFNCGHSAVFDPSEQMSMPTNMKIVLEAFGIPEVDWQPVLFSALIRGTGPKHHTVPSLTDIEPKEISFPPYFYLLTDDVEDEWAQAAIDYLTNDRGIDWKSHPFYLVKKVKTPGSAQWYGRLIIPVYKDNKLIFWQGRDLTGLHQKKYLSPDVPRDRVIGGYDKLQEYTQAPLYIMEGWFDAYWLNGIAIFGNKMTPEQIRWISKSSRPKIVIPDRFGDGQLLALQALKLGWSISLPDTGSEKDINDAVKKYGHLYVLKSVKDNTYEGFEAEVQLGLYCKPSDKKSKK